MAIKLLTDIENKTLNPITPPAGLNIPTGSTGLASGMIWSNAGVLNIVP